MSIVYSVADPSLEWLADDDEDDVCDVLPRHPVNLSLNERQCPQRFWILLGKFQHPLYAEAFKIWNIDVLCLGAVDLSPFVCGQVFQVED